MTAFWVILGALVVFGAGFVAGYSRVMPYIPFLFDGPEKGERETKEI